MSERERRALARIERHLAESDPRLASMLSTHRLPGHSAPVLLLAIGLAAILLGGVTATIPLVLGGAAIALSALVVAAIRSVRLAPSIV
jgi:hypothetical protein